MASCAKVRTGDTFHFRKHSDDHLWVVISDPERNPHDPVVLVNLATYKQHLDKSCILQPGDHPYINHTTIISYRDARVFSRGQILADMQLRTPFRPNILRRIIQGAAKTDYLIEEYRLILVKQGLIV
jgi:hypothetical protein